MKDLRTEEGKAEAAASLHKWDRKWRAANAAVRRANKKFAGQWNAIDTMPFAAYAEASDGDTVLLSDGESVAVATVHKRFGRPIKVVDRGEMAMTDHGLTYVGVKYEEYDHPQWWFKWEFTDQLSRDDERYGRDEVGFVATHWQPLPAPPCDSDRSGEAMETGTGSTEGESAGP